MDAALATWLAFRALRWIGWLGFLGYSIAFFVNPQSHFDSFGQLHHTTEAAMFGFSVVAIFAVYQTCPQVSRCATGVRAKIPQTASRGAMMPTYSSRSA